MENHLHNELLITTVAMYRGCCESQQNVKSLKDLITIFDVIPIYHFLIPKKDTSC
jgi:hypothetical protein